MSFQGVRQRKWRGAESAESFDNEAAVVVVYYCSPPLHFLFHFLIYRSLACILSVTEVARSRSISCARWGGRARPRNAVGKVVRRM